MTNARIHDDSQQGLGQPVDRRSVIKGAAGLTGAALLFSNSSRFVSARQSDATAEATPALLWDDADQLFAAAAPDVTMLAAELIDGVVIPMHGLNADVVQPVASSFKLWILGALATEIEAGRIEWEQPIEIQDLHRSVPGGDLRYALPGSQYTVRYLAERMMQKSDNTATDHLFYLVGREQVEAASIAMGLSDPEINFPIISTRELALLKFGHTTEELDEIYGLLPEDRRRYLDEDLASINIDSLPDIDQTEPLELDRVEWFGTRLDLANAMNWLDLKSREPGMLPVGEVIALETQLPWDGSIWPYVGFKGGSELGLLTGTWLLHRADGRHFVYSTGFKNLESAIDMATAVAAMEAGQELMAQIP